MKDVTIGIKTFLRPSALEDCLISIRKYYNNIKIIVCDDSDPANKELARAISKKYNCQFIELPFYSGTGAGRKALTNATNTKYYVTVDDDMVFTEHTDLSKFKRFLKETGYDMIGGAVPTRVGANNIPAVKPLKFIGEGGKLYFVDRDEHKIKVDFVKAYQCEFTSQFFMVKTALVKKVTWNPRLKTADHREFFVRLKLEAGPKIAFTRDVFILHRQPKNIPMYDKHRRGNNDAYQKLAKKIIKKMYDIHSSKEPK